MKTIGSLSLEGPDYQSPPSVPGPWGITLPLLAIALFAGMLGPIVLVPVALPVLIVTAIKSHTFPYYRRFYRDLVTGRYKPRLDWGTSNLIVFGDQADIECIHVHKATRSCALYFEDGTIKMSTHNMFLPERFSYLRNSILTYLSPYSLYWYLKIGRFMRKAIKREMENLGPTDQRRQARISRVL